MGSSTGVSESLVRHYATQQVPWGPVGYITYKRTYARFIQDLGRTEEWHETCARVCNGLVDIGGIFSQKELESLYDSMFYLKGFVGGRSLWQLGTETVERLGADSLVNCWATSLSTLESFCFAFDELMLGGGVGFNILPENVYSLPTVKFDPPIIRVETPDCDFIVPDNREGWVDLLRRVLKAFFKNGRPLTYSTQCVRAAGKIIHSFGGVASGSEPLVVGIQQVAEILRKRVGMKLRPIDCMDIMNIVGTIVVSGNVRRSSQIALGHPQDLEFLRAKDWNIQTVPNWRCMSNNAVASDTIEELPPEYWKPYTEGGECYGLLNLNNCRRYGRLADGVDYRPDFGVMACNPCGEIPLEVSDDGSGEPCNLAEIVLPNIKDLNELIKVILPLYKACKTVANCAYLHEGTQDIVDRNYRIGIGITGWMAAPRARNKDFLNKGYHALEEMDILYSALLGVPTSVKLTTCKPSGTVSLLPQGVTPGVHAAFNRYLIRRIRFAANDPLVEVCRQHGYHVEPELRLDGTHNHETMVIEFPMDYGPEAITENQVNVIQELENQKFLQTYWSDNAISCSHYFHPEEVPDIRRWLKENYESSVKTVSFMHTVADGFHQMPLEKITEEQYHELCSSVHSITQITDDHEIDMVDSLECAGGSCPVK